jgi:hypothetical protein
MQKAVRLVAVFGLLVAEQFPRAVALAGTRNALLAAESRRQGLARCRYCDRTICKEWAGTGGRGAGEEAGSPIYAKCDTAVGVPER